MLQKYCLGIGYKININRQQILQTKAIRITTNSDYLSNTCIKPVSVRKNTYNETS